MKINASHLLAAALFIGIGVLVFHHNTAAPFPLAQSAIPHPSESTLAIKPIKNEAVAVDRESNSERSLRISELERQRSFV